MPYLKVAPLPCQRRAPELPGTPIIGSKPRQPGQRQTARWPGEGRPLQVGLFGSAMSCQRQDLGIPTLDLDFPARVVSAERGGPRSRRKSGSGVAQAAGSVLIQLPDVGLTLRAVAEPYRQPCGSPCRPGARRQSACQVPNATALPGPSPPHRGSQFGPVMPITRRMKRTSAVWTAWLA